MKKGVILDTYAGVDDAMAIDWSLLPEKYAVDLILEIVGQNPGQVSIIPTGPLNSAVKAIQMYEGPCFSNKFQVVGEGVINRFGQPCLLDVK